MVDAVVEYAYFDGGIKGNSKVAVTYLEVVKDFAVKSNVRELAFSSDNFSAILLTYPIVIFVRVQGDIADAKLHARKILRELGFEKKVNLDEIFELAEKIEEMPIEEVVRRLSKS